MSAVLMRITPASTVVRSFIGGASRLAFVLFAWALRLTSLHGRYRGMLGLSRRHGWSTLRTRLMLLLQLFLDLILLYHRVDLLYHAHLLTDHVFELINLFRLLALQNSATRDLSHTESRIINTTIGLPLVIVVKSSELSIAVQGDNTMVLA